METNTYLLDALQTKNTDTIRLRTHSLVQTAPSVILSVAATISTPAIAASTISFAPAVMFPALVTAAAAAAAATNETQAFGNHVTNHLNATAKQVAEDSTRQTSQVVARSGTTFSTVHDNCSKHECLGNVFHLLGVGGSDLI